MAVLLRQAVAVIDGRTSVVCLDIAGDIVRVDEPFHTLNGDYDAPPFHVHCRTFVRPLLSAMGTAVTQAIKAEAKQELSRRSPRVRASVANGRFRKIPDEPKIVEPPPGP